MSCALCDNHVQAINTHASATAAIDASFAAGLFIVLVATRRPDFDREAFLKSIIDGACEGHRPRLEHCRDVTAGLDPYTGRRE
jgi:hypothetical protein